jgi:transposase InsO family protein
LITPPLKEHGEINPSTSGTAGNAIAERWIGTIRRELPDRILIINRRHLTAVLTEYMVHFNHHRPHRALNQAAPLRSLPPPASHPNVTSNVAIYSTG